MATSPSSSCAQSAPVLPDGLLNAFSRQRVLVVGDIVADEYLYGETDRISREAPVLIVRYESSVVKLGGAGNAAANLRALGADVTMLGIVGKDAMGSAVRAEAERQGIRLVTPLAEGLTTETKTRVLAGGRNTRRQQMLRIDRGQKKLLPEAEDALAELLRREAQSCGAILVSDYGAGVLCPKVIAEVLALAAEGKLVCVDSRYNLAAFTGATLLKPNEAEFEALAGVHAPDDARLAQVIAETRARMRAKALLVTRGSSGMVLSTEDGILTIPAYGTHETVDVTGAGDTVAASLALALAAGASFAQAAHLANISGALKVRKAGTVTVSRRELADEMECPS